MATINITNDPVLVNTGMVMVQSLKSLEVVGKEKNNYCLNFSLVFPIIWILMNILVVII